ncbi:MAG: (d)CMP kinase [Bdellovibrionales bacterium]
MQDIETLGRKMIARKVTPKVDPKVIKKPAKKSGKKSLKPSAKNLKKARPNTRAALATPMIVTIDGPAASGKTSVSRELARLLEWKWVSTGAFYRGLALAALSEGVDSKNEKAIVKLAKSKIWRVEMQAEQTKVFLRDQDVTARINEESVGTAASQISQFPLVRAELLPLQRNCLKGIKGGLIAEGRDCGTVVFPKAPIKIYLTARSDDRAQRRAKEQGATISQIKKDQSRRDKRDSQRATAPLQVSSEAKVVDTSDLSFDEVVGTLHKWVIRHSRRS